MATPETWIAWGLFGLIGCALIPEGITIDWPKSEDGESKPDRAHRHRFELLEAREAQKVAAESRKEAVQIRKEERAAMRKVAEKSGPLATLATPGEAQSESAPDPISPLTGLPESTVYTMARGRLEPIESGKEPKPWFRVIGSELEKA